MKRILLIGASGSGRTTQSKRLAAHLGVISLSSLHVLEECVAQNAQLSEKVQSFVGKGELIPDELVIEVMRSRLSAADVQQGWVLEGYPRTAFQAEELDFLLDQLHTPLDRVFYLEVPEATLKERALGRGDGEEVIARRIEIFFQRNSTLIEYYGYKQLLVSIDGTADPDTVTAQLLAYL